VRSKILHAVGCAVFAGTVGLSSLAGAGQPVIYPAKGQSPQQQAKDQGECQVWAQQTTGVDPAALAAAPTAQPQVPPGGTRVRGAARGAAGGAAIGAIAGDAETGAAAGALAGTMRSGRAARMAQARQAQSAQAANAQKQQKMETYYRALSACMVGRGYTVQ
jgi:hypothetical protein